MDTNKILSHLSWMISAVKEQTQFLSKDIKNLLQNKYLKTEKKLLKAQYHLNMSKVLLSQVERNYSSLIRLGRINSSSLLQIKNTYLQRSMFQLSMGFDYYKETSHHVEQISKAMANSIYAKWMQPICLMQKLIHDFDFLLANMKE